VAETDRRRLKMSDADMPSVFSDKMRTAHKAHKCCECRRIIKTGEKYHFAKGCWDGRWDEFKTCEECHGLRHELKDGWEMAPFGYLHEWAENSDIPFPIAE
jgi:hypothetical protein